MKCRNYILNAIKEFQEMHVDCGETYIRQWNMNKNMPVTSFSHQDWTPVVVHKNNKNGVSKNVVKRETIAQTTGRPAWAIERDAEDCKKLPLCTCEERMTVIRGRIAKEWSQEKLAQMVNINAKIIRDIESGIGVRNGTILSKIKRVLQ